MLDAGSSHTTVYIYTWPGEKENDTGVVSQIGECMVQGKMKKRGGGTVGHEMHVLVEYSKKSKSSEEYRGAAAVISLSLT